MKKLTQKWCIVSLLDDQKDASTFLFKDWPLHLTIGGNFSIDKSGKDITELVQSIIKSTQTFQLHIESYAYWGKDGSIKVSLTNQSPEIMSLHNDIIELLYKNGAEFSEPQYVGKNYKPHVTHQKEGLLSIGDTFTVKKISIVDMFPDEDGYSRRIVSSLPLQNN